MTSLIKPGALILVLLVVGVAVASLLLSNSKGEGRTASPASPIPLADLGVPPIDAAVPANAETATFALG
jgi:hypothetical protein